MVIYRSISSQDGTRFGFNSLAANAGQAIQERLANFNKKCRGQHRTVWKLHKEQIVLKAIIPCFPQIYARCE